VRPLWILLFLLVVACGQERRHFREMPPGLQPDSTVKPHDFEAGGPAPPDSTKSSYQDNAYALSQGRWLYNQMNCVGCHLHGGGGIGPPLMDDEWIYGGDPAQVFATIVEGRPNGMPSFERRLTNQQVWQLVAYVRSLSGQGGSSSSSSREDHMYLSPNLAVRSPEKPRGKTIPEP
jgi:cytochrome c oxidase cbb3-type subunit III